MADNVAEDGEYFGTGRDYRDLHKNKVVGMQGALDRIKARSKGQSVP